MVLIFLEIEFSLKQNFNPFRRLRMTNACFWDGRFNDAVWEWFMADDPTALDKILALAQ
jgi:hypothetical protein